jgi:hypothetical protein
MRLYIDSQVFDTSSLYDWLKTIVVVYYKLPSSIYYVIPIIAFVHVFMFTDLLVGLLKWHLLASIIFLNLLTSLNLFDGFF